MRCGCAGCIAACPYDAIFSNPEDNSAEKCNLCAHRLDVGLEPACVTVCPTGAILVGDLNDPESKVAEIVQREAVAVRRPQKGTRPGLFYKGAHQATLDPLAARRPDGGLFAWATQGGEHDPGHVTAGHPGRPSSSAEALLCYDIPHHAPWGWRVSLYTRTKGLAAGGLLVPLILILPGHLTWASPLARWAAPGVALAFLGITGVLLVWDLRHPGRFYLIFTRHHWRSWLVRGSFILGGYGGAVTLYLIGSLAGSVVVRQVAALPPPAQLPLALRTAPAHTGPDGRVSDLTAALTTPARSGIILTRRRVARGAGNAGVGHRIGERRFALRAMLEQDPAATLAWLAQEAERWQVRHGRRAADDLTARWWTARASRTTQLLRESAADALDRTRTRAATTAGLGRTGHDGTHPAAGP